MLRAIATGLMVVVPLLSGAAAQAAVIQYETALSGLNEAPPNASPGTGTALVTYDDVALTMRYEVSFSGLLAPTTAAHVHCCTSFSFPDNVGVASQVPSFAGFPLGVTSGVWDATFDLTSATSWNPNFITAHGGSPLTALADLLAGMNDERAYFNIHTTAFGGGEIRGFLQQVADVPEPASLALLAAGLIGIAGVRRSRG